MATTPSPPLDRDVRRAFVERVKAIDPVFKQGQLDAFWPELRKLVGMAPGRRDLALKKSHYIASLAARSLDRGDPRSALAFLDFADEALDAGQLTPFLLRERELLRRQAKSAVSERPPDD